MITPGHRLRLLLAERELDQNQLAERLGVTRQTINYIVNSRQPISRDMASKLARLSGHTPGYWLQFEFDEPGAPPAAENAGASVLVDAQIRKAVRDGIIAITPFDPDNIQPASIDLTLGEITRANKVAHVLSARGHPVLERHELVHLRARETVRFPDDYLGRVGPMAAVSRFGIFMAHGLQVDPGYHGELEFCLFNASDRDFELVFGAPIISLEIMRLATAHSRAKTITPHDPREVQRHFGAARPNADYTAFIARNAGRISLNREEARGLALALGLQADDAFITARAGEHIPLPHGVSEIALETLAGQLGEAMDAVILALSYSLPPARDNTVAPSGGVRSA